MKINPQALINSLMLLSGSIAIGFGTHNGLIALGVFFVGSAYLNPGRK